MISDSANSPISLYSLGWDENDVFRVVMVMSYYHGDFVVHIENSMNMTGIILSHWLVSGCGQQSNNSPQGSVSGVFLVYCCILYM